MIEVFREVRRVLRKDGTLWLNLGDSYASGPGSQAQGENGQMADRSVVKHRGSNVPQTKNPNVSFPADAPHRGSVVGLTPKNLVGIPWRVAFALQSDGWWLRSDIVWAKPNPMPESVRDRPTRSHEYLFLLTKSARYYYDADAIAEPGVYAGPNGAQHSPHGQGFTRRTPEQEAERQDKQRGHGRRHAGFNDRWDAMEKSDQCGLMRNARSVWQIATQPYSEAHFATFPPEIPRRCILAGSRPGDLVLDPFVGAGTTLLVAHRLGRDSIGIELSPAYCALARERIRADAPLLVP